MSSSSNKISSIANSNHSSSDSENSPYKEDVNSLGQHSNNSSSYTKEKEAEALKEKEKTKLAAKIQKENENFMKGVEQSRHERLKFLLKQTEIFAHFLIGGKVEDQKDSSKQRLDKNSKKKKRKNSEAECDKGDMKNLKILNQKNQIDESELVMESKQITRLYAQPSILTGGKLTNYQLDGLNWLISLYERGLNGILADEMGLGKTIQSIALMAYLKQFQKKNGYFIVIVPKSTMPNWSRECKTWFPSLNFIVLNPVKEEREETLKLIEKHKFEVVITSYEGVNLCINKLKKIKWELLIIDEAHRIKNENALLSKNVRLLESKFRVLVTGTPLQNNLHELWALLNFLLPDIFSSSADFDEWFEMSDNKKNDNENGENKSSNEDVEDRNAEIVQQLHKILKPFLLRRTKAEVERSLPPKKEIHIKVGLTELQKELYKNLLRSSLLQDSKTIYKNILMQLRKVCNHPYLFDGVEKPNPPVNHLVIYSSKMRILDKLCAKLYGKSQMLIFSQMTRMLDILEDYCYEKGYKYCRIDGDTSLIDRETMINEFTKPNSDKFLFLLSTRAGGLGLNLMSADTVILYDSDWNPQVDLQAMDRVHRIGQTKPVLIYRLICENTIEEKIIERQAMRLKLDSLVIQQGRVLKVGEHFTKDQMKEMIQYGADVIFRAGNEFKDEDIDLILKRGEQQTNQFFEEAEKQAKSKSNLLLNFSFDPSDLYKFENEDYAKIRKENADKALSLAYAEELENENKALNAKRDHGHVNYNIEQTQAQLFGSNKNKAKKNKVPKIPYYHLYKNRERLIELKQKQINYYIKNNIKIPEKIDEDPTIQEGLTEQEFNEMKTILESGFKNWDRADYDNFLSFIEKYNKEDKEILYRSFPNKEKEEVLKFFNKFWDMINELPDGQRILKNKEKKEKLMKQKNLSDNLIKMKCEKLEDDNYNDIKINFPTSSHQNEYSLEEDQYLIYLTYKFGYGNWDDILREIKMSEELLFNYYLKSRNKSEIQKRIDYLIKIIEKEIGSSNKINVKDTEKRKKNGKNNHDNLGNQSESKKEEDESNKNIVEVCENNSDKLNNDEDNNLDDKTNTIHNINSDNVIEIDDEDVEMNEPKKNDNDLVMEIEENEEDKK